MSQEPIDPAERSAEPLAESTEAADPSVAQVYAYLTYGLSLPERAVRTTSALVGGAVSESAALLLPQAFRSSRSYDLFVQQMLDFVVRDVGGVRQAGSDPAVAAQVEAYVARKAVGNFIDLVGRATLHLSPLTVLAITTDIAYGSQIYLKELSEELKQAGLIDDATTIDHATDLLDALGNTSSATAVALDTPPFSVEGLRDTIAQVQQAAEGIDPAGLIPQAEVQQLWDQMHEVAARENVGLLELSSAMSLFAIDKIGNVGQGALSTVKVTGNMFDRHIFDHYRRGLGEIRDKGFYATFAEVSGPYIDAVWQNFSSQRPTITENLMSGRLLRQAWDGVSGWFAAGGDPADETQVDREPPEKDGDQAEPSRDGR